MADGFSYETNLLRAIVAAVNASVTLTISREMFAKGYFELGAHEKAIVDEASDRMIGGFFRSLGPEAFGSGPKARFVGFQSQTKSDAPTTPQG